MASTSTFTSAGDLAQFTGTSPFTTTLTATDDFTVTTLLSLLNGAGLAGSGSYVGTVTVVYTYTPAHLVTGSVYADVDHSGARAASEAGTGRPLYVKLASRVNGACQAPALSASTVDPVSGTYSLGAVEGATYCLVLDTSPSLANVAGGRPTGFVGTQAASGVRVFTMSSTNVVDQDFGLYPGASVTGRVFDDTGIGGGVANDGVPNGAEPGLGDATVSLVSAGTTLGTSLTDGGGAYTLWIPAGTTSVAVVASPSSGRLATGGSVGTTGGSYARSNASVAFTAVPGNAYDGVHFGTVRANVWVSDAVQSATPGSFALFAHAFTAGSSGQATFASSSNPVPAGLAWTQTLYLDANCNGVFDTGEGALSGALPVTAGQRVCVLMRQSTPPDAPPGAQNAVTVSATMAYANASPSLSTSVSNVDVTTIGASSSLTLTKLVRNVTTSSAFGTANAASPDDVIEYQVTAINRSADAVASVVVHDATPAYTTFVSATCPSALPASMTACAVAQPGIGGTGPVEWAFTGVLASGASVTTTYRVKVAKWRSVKWMAPMEKAAGSSRLAAAFGVVAGTGFEPVTFGL